VRALVSCVIVVAINLYVAAACAQTPAQTPDAMSPAPPPVVPPKNLAPSPTPIKADGIQLPVVSDVSASVRIEAVLIPSSAGKRIFGKAISDKYAIVQITISNHNQNAALILQNAFLDYSHWLFSNNFQAPIKRDQSIETTSFQQADKPSQVSSTEARLVRSDLQDAQFWTARNTFIRAITAIATIASAYQFLASKDYISGISGFGNQVVPAMGTFWPDRTQLQINRVSDFGFQTNKVIPKGSSDIVVAFFPLDRFLTPSLRSTFLKAPAVFFVPGEMLIDSKYSSTLATMLINAGVIKAEDPNPIGTVSGALGHYERLRTCMAKPAPRECAKLSDPQKVQECWDKLVYERCTRSEQDSVKVSACEANNGCGELSDDETVILGVLDKVSLNNIRVVISGIMSVDVNSIPAVIDSVDISDLDKADAWKSGSKVHGVINGSFLSGGVPSVVDGDKLGIGNFVVDSPNSTDTKLTFSFTLSKDVPTETKLKFIVTKQAKDGSSTVSKPSNEVVVKYAAAGPGGGAPGAAAPAGIPAPTPAPSPTAKPQKK
jgi:hypothetical protein